MIEHRNVVNFFAAMDRKIPKPDGQPLVWLAVTSLSFDISVLELLWTLTRGFKVVIHDEARIKSAPARASASGAESTHSLGLGLFMWGNDDAAGPAKYRLLIEGAKFFDENGFAAVWTPERHFHAFGGPYPNPAVTGAAVAAVTKHVKIRAGSCVVPLHHPVRIAEEWSVVDNLSNGRVEIAAASGWNPNDFVLRPENHANSKQVMFTQLEQVRKLWRGEKLAFPGPLGKDVAVQSLPRPVQAELPCWITTAGNPETWRDAGARGFNVLTHLLGQTVAEVGEKIRIYREARAAAGFDPAAGQVALMLHTFVGEDDDDGARARPQADEIVSRELDALGDGFRMVVPGVQASGRSASETRGRRYQDACPPRRSTRSSTLPSSAISRRAVYSARSRRASSSSRSASRSASRRSRACSTSASTPKPSCRACRSSRS